ncbi:MAG: peptide chain release factor N(5)-glutamine methyltransferase [Planctomycetota bacterium]|jgi:release factor glutamine methyltransferase|nr:peptide chain release factor N(5)-glutamine methyltransferase [Planctomycetota bacterium]MDA1202578.1 peptide chain release factor N(5)-glutamine methyltransferase [Planctomycetota bacterium]
MSDDEWTVGRLLSWTTGWLGERGSESARLDAEILLAHVRGCQRILLYTAFAEAVPEDQRAEFRTLVRRRGQGEPVAYLVGSKEFFSLPLNVSPAVLVPRPETEGLVVRTLDLCREAGEARIIDVGTGSGAIAVAVAKHLPEAKVAATDISAEALAVARGNAARHGLTERIAFSQGDLLADPAVSGPWDVIIANLPYVREDEFAELPRDVREHEPRLALVGGRRGVELIERLAAQASTRLAPGGWLILEAGPAVAADVEAVLAATAGLELRPTLADLAGLPRVFQACRPPEAGAPAQPGIPAGPALR